MFTPTKTTSCTGTLTPLQYGLTMNLITRQIDPENVYEGEPWGLRFYTWLTDNRSAASWGLV